MLLLIVTSLKNLIVASKSYPSRYLGALQIMEATASANLTGRKVKTKRKESTQWKNPYDMNFSSSRGIFMNVYIFWRRRT